MASPLQRIVVAVALAISVLPGAATTIAMDAEFENWKEPPRIAENIPVVSWIDPKVKPWAVLLCLHGLSLHGQNYEAFGKRMAAIGVPTYAIDIRGFGSWQNTKDKRTTQVDFKSALDDVHLALLSLRAAHPETPIVLVGESMGGALALQAAAANQPIVDGLICSVPAAKRTNQKMNTARVAVGMVTSPNRKLNAGPSVVHAAATHNPELAAMWTTDEMTRMKLSAKELMAFALFTSKNSARAKEITDIPVLLLQGSQDRLIKPEGTMELMGKLGTPKKMLHVLNQEHLILEYHQFDDQLIDFVSGWLQRNAVPTALTRQTKQDSKLSAEAMNTAEGHLRIAQGYLKLGDAKLAEEHLLKVVDAGRGSHYAQDAELLLCTLPSSEIKPDDSVTLSADDLKFITHQQALDNPKPSVVMFYANWIVGCEQVRDSLEYAVSKFGNRVNFVRVDADIPENKRILELYKVRPIPTVIYLSADNKVVGYTFGFPGQDAIDTRIRSLMFSR